MTILKLYNTNDLFRRNLDDVYRFSDVMTDLLSDRYGQQEVYSTPRVNICDEKEDFMIFLAVPGLKKADISINVEDNILSISHQAEKEEEGVYYSSREFNYNNFERSFRIPKTVNTEKIKADYENGILTVKLPKREEAIDRGPKEIKIS